MTADNVPNGAVRSFSAPMFRIVRLQLIATLVVGLIVGLAAGPAALASLWMGAFACAAPNALFAFRIWMATARSGNASPATFFVGELGKIGATIALLAVAIRTYEDMVWWALLLGMIVALKSYLLALIRN